MNLEKSKEGFPIDAINEIKHLRTLNHPNIINFLEVVVDKYIKYEKVKNNTNMSLYYPWNFYIVTEYAEHTLSGLIQRGCTFDYSKTKCILKQILEGLEYMHNQNIVHRDIKCSNILVTSSGIVKLADLGMSKGFKEDVLLKKETGIVTLWYRAPELLYRNDYSKVIDMWAVGCVMGKLITGKAIFRGKDEKHQLEIIMKELTGNKPILWEKLKSKSDSMTLDLMERMLKLNPNDRITVKQALVHPYFLAKPKACKASELKLLDGESHEFFIKEQRESILNYNVQNECTYKDLFKARKHSLLVNEDQLSLPRKIISL